MLEKWTGNGGLDQSHRTWGWFAWMAHLAAFAVILSYFWTDFIHLKDSSTAVFYVTLNTVVTFYGLFSLTFFKGNIGRLLAFILVTTATLAIGGGVFHVTHDPKQLVVTMMAWTVLLIAVCPLLVALLVVCCSCAVCIFVHHLSPDLLVSVDFSDYFVWIALYLGLAAVGFMWRFVLNHLYKVLLAPPRRVAVQGGSGDEVKQLREALALHIARLNELTGHTYEAGEKEEGTEA